MFIAMASFHNCLELRRSGILAEDGRPPEQVVPTELCNFVAPVSISMLLPPAVEVAPHKKLAIRIRGRKPGRCALAGRKQIQFCRRTLEGRRRKLTRQRRGVGSSEEAVASHRLSELKVTR